MSAPATPQPAASAPHPLIAVDIDGVLALDPTLHGGIPPLRRAGYFPHPVHTPTATRTVWANTRHGAWLHELRRRGAHLAWAGTGGRDAARIMAPLLGLPDDLACLPVPAAASIHWGHSDKLPALIAAADGAPMALLDDQIGGKDPDWAADRTAAGQPTLLLAVNPGRGLTRHHILRLHHWLDTLHPHYPVRHRHPIATTELVGGDGNIFAVLARATRALRRAGYPEDADEMRDRVLASHNYHQALGILCDYVDDAHHLGPPHPH